MSFTKLFLFIALSFVLILLLVPPEVRADSSQQIFTFDRSELVFTKLDGYDVVRYRDIELSRIEGSPQLPVKFVLLPLPPGKDIETVTVTALESEDLGGEYFLFPAQPPRILSRPDHHPFVQPDPGIYSSSEPFPREIVTVASHGYLAGYNVGALRVYPVQYFPSQKKLILFSKIEVSISYKASKRLPLPFKPTKYSQSVRENAVKAVLGDPKPYIQPSQRLYQSTSILPDEEHAYVIITANYMADAFQPLADWKHKKGLSAKIVATTWIYANYSGADAAEKVRNFIKDAYQNWGTVWVLLGGDDHVVPIRGAWAFNCEYGSPLDNWIPCDLYFSDLDGDWNANGNSYYGEVSDNVDMYPDVFVGRASIEDTSEAAAFTSKVLSYEFYPAGCEQDILFLADVLWDNPYTNSGESKDLIDSLYVPSNFDPITKLYKALGNESYQTAMDALNAGHNIVNHCGHAFYGTMSVGTGHLVNKDMDALTNAPRYSILFSIGCFPAAIDYDCIAEHFIQNPDGGGVAFIGNSRYGWGSPGNPLYGYSDRFDQEFYRQLFVKNYYHVGQTLAFTKAVFIPFSLQENVYRWCEYQTNLLGEPEMPIWTDAPRLMVVDFPGELPAGNSLCSITVTDGNGPVADALVCLMQEPYVYESAFTGQNGRVGMEIHTTHPAEPIHITVTAHNAVPFESTISVVSNGPYVQVSSYSTTDILNETQYVIPGDLEHIGAYFKNYGSDTAFAVSAVLRSDNGFVALVDSFAEVGDIVPGDSTMVLCAFSFEADSNLLDGEVVYFDLEIADTSGNVWTDKLSVTGATPALSLVDYLVSDVAYGDGDGFAEPGEIVKVDMLVRNTGLRPAFNVEANLSSESPYVNILNTPVMYWEISPSGSGQVPADIEIDAACPEPSFPQIDISYVTQDGYEFSDSFSIAIGEFGFFDDMENGEASWTHSGSYDYWHLSEHRKHSESHSWYCGTEALFTYTHLMRANLVSAPIIIQENSELSFWAWYEFTNYGLDGCFVEVYDGSEWTTLDFLGSGGALGALPTWNDWIEYTYDLSDYPPGTSITLRFRFYTDNQDVEEGIYIDDVVVRRAVSGNMVTDVPPVNDVLSGCFLYQNYPNPFNPNTTIRYALDKPGHVKIEVFNIQGARVRVLKNGAADAGPNAVVWDGKNDDGQIVSSGIYLYRMTAGGFRETKKMLFLK